MVSSVRRLGSEYFFWISWILGLISCMPRIECSMRKVRGNVTTRVITVNSRIAMPNEPNASADSATRKLISGVSRKVCQIRPIGIGVLVCGARAL